MTRYICTADRCKWLKDEGGVGFCPRNPCPYAASCPKDREKADREVGIFLGVCQKLLDRMRRRDRAINK